MSVSFFVPANAETWTVEVGFLAGAPHVPSQSGLEHIVKVLITTSN